MNTKFTRASLMVASVVALTSMAHAATSDSSQDARRAAFEECATAAGLSRPEAGQRPTAPTDEQRQSLDACLKAKGFEPPTRMGGGGGGRPPGPPPDGFGGGGSGVE
ncbi:hypothetical protein [Bdellovibrio sp. NC01]|uniref:hypothetical protein n=1 Tax=Bdellovibrio sp. NC01 TaxID=2220073 RepID=UPI001AEF70D9|nr:hypothetical protein [Bdellovibrio sp. NC01]